VPVGYKAALALQYFTDTDPEGNPIDSAEEELAKLRDEAEYEQSASSGGGALLSKFFSSQEKENVSPFDIMAGMQQPQAVDQEPPVQVAQGFADGGFVFGGTSLPFAPDWSIGANYTPEDKARIDAMQNQIDTYNKAVQDYEKSLEWTKDPTNYVPFDIALNTYGDWVNSYNRYQSIASEAAADWNSMGPQLQTYFKGLSLKLDGEE
jgi:hypothetical protein